MNLYFITICLMAVAAVNAGRIRMHTGKEQHFNYFPLATDYLEFSVKAKSDVNVVLSNSHDIDSTFYQIALGAWINTRSAVYKDNSDIRVEYKGAIWEPNEFHTFWIKINETAGEIVVGKLVGGPFLRYTDENFVKMSYFAISTGYGYEGEWHFDTKMLCPAKRCSA